MTNLCTKVTVRQRKLAKGKVSLYLDYYPAIRHPKTGRMTRREYLGIYIYASPTERFQQEYNRSMMKKAELTKCRRTESVINEQFGFLDRAKGRESFLDYFEELMNTSEYGHNWHTAFGHFKNYCGGVCCFDDITPEYCQGFLTYLMSEKCAKNGKLMMASSANNCLCKLKAVLKIAFENGKIKEDVSRKLEKAKDDSTPRAFLTLEEVKRLAGTPCKSDVMKRASLFSVLTGLRVSDIIRLKWENVEKSPDGNWMLHFRSKKTKKECFLPVSDEAVELCGERGDGQVFKGFTKGVVTYHLHDWLRDAGITKYITFHCFRHTFATLQLAAGTDIYTISKLLTHSDISTTQIYVDVVSDLKRDATKKISLKGSECK